MIEIIFAIIIVLLTLGIIGAILMVIAIQRQERHERELDMMFDKELERGICPLVHRKCRKGAGMNGQPLPCNSCRLYISFSGAPEEQYEDMEDYSE